MKVTLERSFPLAAQPAGATAGPPAAAAPAARPLNGLALLWGMLRSWLRYLVGARRT